MKGFFLLEIIYRVKIVMGRFFMLIFFFIIDVMKDDRVFLTLFLIIYYEFREVGEG